MIREVKNLSPNFKQIAWIWFTLMNILTEIVRSILQLNSKQFWYLNYSISFESYMILTRVENQKTTFSNRLRAIEQICMLVPLKQNVLDLMSLETSFASFNLDNYELLLCWVEVFLRLTEYFQKFQFVREVLVLR